MAEKPSFLLRIDPRVLEAVRRSASAELRSVNAHMEVLLREALRRRGQEPAAPEDAAETLPPDDVSAR